MVGCRGPSEASCVLKAADHHTQVPNDFLADVTVYGSDCFKRQGSGMTELE